MEIYYIIDEFSKNFDKLTAGYRLPSNTSKKRCNRAYSDVRQRDIITIMILFHQSHCRNLKFFHVNHIKREHSRKVFKGMATKGKSTVGWFFGFKLHLVINDKGKIIQFQLSQANVDDHEPLKDKRFHEKIFGKLFADRGYISQTLFLYAFCGQYPPDYQTEKEYEECPDADS
jgi:uncharacterized protein YfbU (UPF0304 family)